MLKSGQGYENISKVVRDMVGAKGADRRKKHKCSTELKSREGESNEVQNILTKKNMRNFPLVLKGSGPVGTE